MANGTTTVTPAQVEELTESVMEEQRNLLDKLPRVVKVVGGFMLAVLLALAIAACAAVAGASTAAAPVVMMACAAALVALIALLIDTVRAHMNESAEADEIELKMERLEEMKALLD